MLSFLFFLLSNIFYIMMTKMIPLNFLYRFFNQLKYKETWVYCQSILDLSEKLKALNWVDTRVLLTFKQAYIVQLFANFCRCSCFFIWKYFFFISCSSLASLSISYLYSEAWDSYMFSSDASLWIFLKLLRLTLYFSVK